MAYATLDQVKRWLNIPSDDTTDDAELTELLESVDAEIQAILSKYTSSPPESDSVIARYEAIWVAGLYRMQYEKINDIHPWVKHAREKLEEYLKAKYRGGFQSA
ncbi:MAG: phage head-tail connector protein [Candidatus Methanospirareceae archaeon]